MTEARRSRGARSRTVALAAMALAVTAAVLIYRPDRELPFDMLDFSEFLPILQSSDSFGETTRELTRYYAGHGRANVLPYALLSAKWELFGWWSPGWQWSRFVLMIGVVVLAYHLIRRLGATTMAAVAGSSVFLVAPAAARGWIRLTMGEPLGTFLLLALCLTVLPASRLRGSRRRWLVVLLLVAGILVTKEMLAAALVLPLGLLVLTDEDGRLVRPTLSRHAWQGLVAFALLTVVMLAPMLRIALDTSDGKYASLYGTSLRPAGQIMATWLATYVPLDPVHGLPGGALQVALALFGAMIVLGSWLHVRPVRSNMQRVWLLGLAALLPLVCALIYAPWPAYQEFYALPFLIGTAILISCALTGWQQHSSRITAVAAYSLFGVILVVAGTGAHWQAGSAAATQLANFRLVKQVAQMPGVDTVLVATSFVAPQTWQGPAGSLKRYATALNLHWPVARDIPCSRVGVPDGPARANTVVIYRAELCDHLAGEQIVVRYRRFSLRRLRLVGDSVRIDIEVNGRRLSGSTERYSTV